MIKVPLALVVFLAVLSSITATSSQTAVARPWPGARGGGHAMAFDERRGLTMLYGDRGADASTLWAWDGRRWRSFDGAGPGLRRHIKLAYDRARDRLVMYGGYDDAGLEIRSDTWEWDGQRWLGIDAPGPGPRSSYSLALRSATKGGHPLRRLVAGRSKSRHLDVGRERAGPGLLMEGPRRAAKPASCSTAALASRC